MIGSKHELDKIVGVQERKQRQSKFSVAEHRTNPCIQQGGQRECGVCTRWDCFHHEEQGKSICRRMDASEDCHSELGQPRADRSCFNSSVVPGLYMGTQIIRVNMM